MTTLAEKLTDVFSGHLYARSRIDTSQYSTVLHDPSTIGALRWALAGDTENHPHPTISDTIRTWVLMVEGEMPSETLNSQAWKAAAVRIVGSASTPAVEVRRAIMVRDWATSLGVPLGKMPEHLLADANDPRISEGGTQTAANQAIFEVMADVASFEGSLPRFDPAADPRAPENVWSPERLAFWNRADPARLLGSLVDAR